MKGIFNQYADISDHRIRSTMTKFAFPISIFMGLVIVTYPKLSLFILLTALILLLFQTKQTIWTVIFLVLVPFSIGEIANVPMTCPPGIGPVIMLD